MAIKVGDLVRVRGSGDYRNSFCVLAIYRSEDHPFDAIVSVSYIEQMGCPRTAHIPIDALELVPQKNIEAA